MNPALPGGASDGSAAAGGGRWSTSVRLGYAFVPYRELWQGRSIAPNPSQLAIDVHLATLQVIATAPTATSLDVQLPAGAVVTRSIMGERTDDSVGDLELRLRQDGSRWWPDAAFAGALALGAVVPTGPYVARSGAANLPPESIALTLGRGVPWWLLEADGRWAIARRVSALAQLSARGPLGQADDGFAWGPEVRTTVGVRVAAKPWLAAVAISDLQWRGGASEPDPFAGGRIASANVGGWQWTAVPSVSATLGRGVSASLGLRIPLVADVVGNQLVPSVGGFVGLTYAPPARRRRPPPPLAAPAPAVGTITVVDYWASWCAPCGEIDARLSAAAPRWPDVVIRRLDATEDGAVELPVEARGLPVVEVFGPDGKRVALLLGPDALDVVAVVDRLRAARRGSSNGLSPLTSPLAAPMGTPPTAPAAPAQESP